MFLFLFKRTALAAELADSFFVRPQSKLDQSARSRAAAALFCFRFREFGKRIAGMVIISIATFGAPLGVSPAQRPRLQRSMRSVLLSCSAEAELSARLSRGRCLCVRGLPSNLHTSWRQRAKLIGGGRILAEQSYPPVLAAGAARQYGMPRYRAPSSRGVHEVTTTSKK
jgi:hypothetical protein